MINIESFNQAIISGEKLSRTPRCLWLGVAKDRRDAIGYCFDGFIYLMKPAQFIYDKNEYEHHTDWPRVWVNNQSWWCVRIQEDEIIKSYVFSRFSEWLDLDLAKMILATDYKSLTSLPSGKIGRYANPRNGYVAECERDMLWLLDVQATLEDVQFTADAKLLYNNNESRFTGHPLQIWSDGIWTRGQFLSGLGRKTEINPDAALLLKFMGKKMALEIGVEKIISIEWCNKNEAIKIESEQTGLFYRYAEEYRAEKWETSIGDFYLLFWEWGSFNGEGDSGDDCDVFTNLSDLKATFLQKTGKQKKLENERNA